MALQAEIENAIKSITDVGSFQNLCNEILVREINLPITALGSKAGSNKTTKGTPDTYFDGKKYILVEYTTTEDISTNLFNKINEDLDKCFDIKYTGLNISDIKEIIYCHTSSNLNTEYNKSIKQRCKKLNVKITVFGINQLAQKIKNKYPYLAEEYLNLSIGNGQIFDLLSFKKNYDSNQIAAKLSTKYIVKQNELINLENEINNSNLIIISGKPGYGKTRLAIEFLEKEKNDYNILCIKNKNNPFGNDFTRFIDRKKNNLIFIDDANTLNERIITILEELNNTQNNVKILITVRDCFLSEIKTICNDYAQSKVLIVKEFTDEQIKVFLENEFNIHNPLYINQITTICEGNPRLAFYAAQIALDSQSLESIANSEQLFELYYSNYFLKIGLSKNEELLKVAGLISIFTRININTFPNDILDKCGLTKQVFLTCCEELVKKEIANKFQDYYMIDEQCICNYFIFIFIYKNKYIDLSIFIKEYFKDFHKIIIQCLNNILNIFYSDKLLSYLKETVSKIWYDLLETEFEYEFVKAFCVLNPDEACIYILNKIDSTPKTSKIIDDVNLYSISQVIDDNILQIIGTLSSTVDTKTLVELICKYLIKCPDQILNAINTFKSFFKIDEYCYRDDFNKINIIVDSLLLYCDDVIHRLFLELANYYLLTKVTNTTPGRHLSINISSFYLSTTKGVLKYRAKIWNKLIDDVKAGKYVPVIIDFLQKYVNGWDENESKELLSFDYDFFLKIIKNINNTFIIELDGIIKLYNRKMTHFKLPVIKSLSKKSFFQQVLDVFNTDYFLEKQERFNAIVQFYNNNKTINYIDFTKIYDKLFEINDNKNTWELSENLDIFMQIIEKDIYKLLQSINLYGNNIHYFCFKIMNYLFKYYKNDEIKELIETVPLEKKDEWLFYYFSNMPISKINQDIYLEFIQYLSSDIDKYMHLCSNRDLRFIESYKIFDSSIYETVFKIILKKKDYNTYIFYCYIDALFYVIDTNEIFSKFNNNLDLIKEIYFEAIKGNVEVDYNGNFLIYFLDNIPNFFIDYIEILNNEILDLRKFISSISSRNEYLLKSKNSYLLLDTLFEQLNKTTLTVFHYQKLHTIFDNNTNEAIKYIKHYIDNNYSNSSNIKNIFYAITNFNWDNKEELILYLVNLNNDIDTIKQLPLHPTFGSVNTTFEENGLKEKDFWINLKQKLPSGIQYLELKKYCNDRIQEMDIIIEDYKKWDFDMNPKFF